MKLNSLVFNKTAVFNLLTLHMNKILAIIYLLNVKLLTFNSVLNLALQFESIY